MKTKSLIALVVASLCIAGAAAGCENHPRPGQEEEEERDQPPGIAEGEQAEEEATRPDETEAVKEQGSELAAFTDEQMMQCIEILETTMKCTADKPFMEVLFAGGEETVGGMTPKELETKADFWREPGGRRQSCHQLLLPEKDYPYRDAETLAKLAEATGAGCVDFGKIMLEADAVKPIADIEL